MKYYSKIDAIKAVRMIPLGTPFLKADAAGKIEITITGGGLGLKDAKDLVESIMELGVKYHLENNKIDAVRDYLQTELDKRTPLPLCNHCGKPLEYKEAPQPCGTCYEYENDHRS